MIDPICRDYPFVSCYSHVALWAKQVSDRSARQLSPSIGKEKAPASTGLLLTLVTRAAPHEQLRG